MEFTLATNESSPGAIPTQLGNFIGVVYSNVLEASLTYYLPLTGGILTGNLGIGSSTNSLNILNVNSFINVSSNITASSNMITSNINSISLNNTGVLTTSTLTQSSQNLITLRGLITSESNISFNQNNNVLSAPIANASLMGGSGSRIILKNAKNSLSLPDAIGLNTDTLWMSSSNILFYLNNQNCISINSNGVIITSNQINQLNPIVNNFFMGKVGIATSISSEYNLNVNGSINASTISVNGASISDGITNTSNYASNISNVIIINTSNYASNISNVIITNTSNYASNISNVILRNTSNYASNISNVIITNTSNYASNISNVIITNTSNYASNISNVIITNTSNFTLGTAFNTSNYALNISNVIITNTSNYASNISNVIITNTSNYTSNISNVIITNTSNYASNISNVLLRNTSNYASNISNVLLINTSNYASNISNVLLINYNSLNTNTSNYASNISNVLLINTSNYASNISNVIITNTSNYASNISNVILRNTSNYASNISNVLLVNYNSLNTTTSNYASNISNVLLINTSNYASNISNVLLINTSNYASNISNVLLRNTSNYASNISNVLLINTSNYASNISNVLLRNTSNYSLNISNILKTNIDTKQDTLTASTVLSGIGSNLTLVNYNTLSNLPNLTVYNGWTKTGNNVYNTITGGNVGVGLNTNITHKLTVNGLSSTNGLLVGFVNTSNFYPNEPGSYIVLRHNTFNNLIGANNPKPECAFIMANNTSGGNLNWSFYSGVVKYATGTQPTTSLRYDIGCGLIPNTLETLTGTNTFNPLMSFLYSGNIGIGSTSPLYKLDVNGSLNSTSFAQNGTLIDFTSYATKNTDIINTSNYASNISNILKTNIDTKQNTLTASTVLSGIGSNLTLINAESISSGILPVSRGGIGTTTLLNNQLLLGNTTSIKSSSLLIYDTVNNRLGVNTSSAAYTIDIRGTARIFGGTQIDNIVFDTDTSYIQYLLFTTGTRSFNLGKSINGDKFGFFSSGGGTPDPDPHFILDRTDGAHRTIVYGSLGVNTIDLTYILNVKGSINSTSLYQNGTIIDFTSYATKNTDIINTSNYASNISNVLLINTSNYALNISNVIITNTSNYASNISNILLTTFKYNSPISTDINNIISLNNSNSVIRYPPSGLLSTNATFSSSSYQNNGTYTVSSSSTPANIFYCFNYTDGEIGGEWTSGISYRSTTPFDYNATTFNTIINGTSNIYGEWVQLYYDKGFVATSIAIICLTANNSPSAFVLAGSTDGSNWILLSQQSGIILASNTFNINNYTSYNYYRIIITNTIGATTVKIAEIKFFGLPNSTYVNNDNFNQIIYNTTEKQFPPRLYDFATTETTYTPLAGNELYGNSQATIYKQELTLNNHGTYTIYSSSSTSTINQLKNELFKFDNSIAVSGAFWASGNYTNGIINKTYNIKSGYNGEWIIVKFPYKIVLTRFRFYNNNTSPYDANKNKAPGLWSCYGSNDGITFTEITEACIYKRLTINNYYLGYFEDIISSTFDIPYLYIGWVINSLVGSDVNATTLNFQELQIFGKDDISNSYSKALTLLSDNRLIYNNISTITTYFSTTNSIALTNKYVRFNYEDEIYFNSGTYNLTFTNGYHSINTSPAITKFTYPILKDSSSNVINPLIWYKFDNSPGLLIDNGSLNNGNLINNGPITIDTTAENYIHGDGSALLNAPAKFFTIPKTIIDLYAINISTGISFTFWIKLTGSSGDNARIFDFGTTGAAGVSVGSQYIAIYKHGSTTHLRFDIGTSSINTSGISGGISNYYDSTWRQITWTITPVGAWSIYINGTKATFTSPPANILIQYSTERLYYIGKGLGPNLGSYNTMYLDDFRIYGKVLSDAEVSELYTGRVEVYTKNNIGIGTTNPNTNYILDVNGNANINGTLTSSSFSGNGGSITNIPYANITGKPSTFPADMSTIYTKTETNNLLSNKQDTLTSTTSLLGTIPYANITGKPTNFQTDWNSTVANKPTNFQADWNSTVANKPTNFQADWNSTVSNKPTTFTPTMTNIYTKAETDGRYLLLSGGTINGSLNINYGFATTHFNYGGYNYIRGHHTYISSSASIDGGLDVTTTLNVGGNFSCSYINCLLYSVNNSGTDYVGVWNANSGNNINYYRQLYIMFESFTAFHRCFINDELFNKDNPQEFKDIYMGRIVVSTGIIKTHFSKTKTDGEPEWEIKTEKEAIIIEDAHPIVELSRKKKDKRVIGVLGLNTRKNSDPERQIVNAIGEGGIWVCNSNGNIENGDYITSSDYLGYGEKQDDDLLHNFTVGKATMDCDFQLDSPLYQCIEINYEGQKVLRCAFIACTYHCG